MPKPLFMRIAVEEISFGRVFRSIKNMEGVISLNIEGDADAPSSGRKTRSNGKVSEGSTGKCIVLRALKPMGKIMTPSDLSALLVTGGKSAKSVSNILFDLKKAKMIKKTAKGYHGTPSGDAWLKKNCTEKEH